MKMTTILFHVIISCIIQEANCNEIWPKEKISLDQVYGIRQFSNSIDRCLGQPDSNRVLGCQLTTNILAISIMISDNLTRGLIERIWWEDAWGIIRSAFCEFEGFSVVRVAGYYPITDVYGNIKTKRIASIDLSLNEFMKINRTNFISSNLPKIGRGRFEWPDE